MPIYEYECPACGEKFEMRRSITDSDSEVKCVRCGAEKPRRVLSTFSTNSPGSISLLTSSFHVDLYQDILGFPQKMTAENPETGLSL